MRRIFISYRRDDSADVSGRIRDRLAEDFGGRAIFTDVDSIPLGVDFHDYIDRYVGQCEVFLPVIGKDWLCALDDEGQLRLDDPTDFVRLEIESALRRDIPVIPLLVRQAEMPEAAELPASLAELSRRNGLPVRPDPDFRRDMERLISGIREHILGSTDIRAPAAKAGKLRTMVNRIRAKLPDRATVLRVLGSAGAGLAAGSIGGALLAYLTGLTILDYVLLGAIFGLIFMAWFSILSRLSH